MGCCDIVALACAGAAYVICRRHRTAPTVQMDGPKALEAEVSYAGHVACMHLNVPSSASTKRPQVNVPRQLARFQNPTLFSSSCLVGLQV